MEEVLFPEWNQFALPDAVEDPLWSYDVELSLLNDPFDVECCQCPLRETLSRVDEDLRVVVPL